MASEPMFDYVLVGAGSAGCVLAARLSEDPGTSVLLLEAGPPDSDENIHLPLGYLKLDPTMLDWGYRSAPEAGCGGREISLPRGKVLGGSSSTNAMIYIRGNRHDYDGWELPGWSAAELLPYFMKAESNERGGSLLHGADGPLYVSDPRSIDAASRAFVEAGLEAGLARNEDFNGVEQEGVGYFQLTQHEGRRASAASAYLDPARGRPNLTVMTGTQAERVLIEDGRAVGVQVADRCGSLQLRAQREVVLCAGAYNSPQLLMLSGLGPAAELRRHGIEVLVNAPGVGENLSDHAATELLWTMPEPQDALSRRHWRSTRLLLAGQQGAFASGLAQAGAFARVAPDSPAPDIQIHFVGVGFAEGEEGNPQPHGAWLSPCLLTPQSRGTVRLAGADSGAAPLISNGFYSSGDDLERMVAALRLGLEIAAQPALRSFCAEPFTTPADAGENALREHIARTTFAFYHPVGTCRMGKDPDAVVDLELRVNGVEGLRVIDASVMPAVPRGNTNAATIAIAERGAELIGGGRSVAPPEDLAGRDRRAFST